MVVGPECDVFLLQKYYHGESIAINVLVDNNTNKTVKKIKISGEVYVCVCVCVCVEVCASEVCLWEGCAGEIVCGEGCAGDVCVFWGCLLYTSPSPRDNPESRIPSSA